MQTQKKANKWMKSCLFVVLSSTCLGLSATSAMAKNMNQDLGWVGSGELGFISASGNTNTLTLSSKLKVGWSNTRWRNETTLSILKATDKCDSSNSDAADRLQLSAQSDYILSPSSYLLANLRRINDAYATFDRQTTMSVGYGYQIVSTPNTDLAIEFGPGQRISREAATGLVYSETVTRLHLKQSWQINQRVEWDNELTREAGPKEALYLFDSGVKVAVLDNLAVKFLFNWRNTSNPAPGKVDTDTVTTVNLVYNFK